MKKFILNLWLLLPVLALAQYGSNQEYKKFTKSEKKFNDWSVTLYGGLPFMQSSDLTSINNLSNFNSDSANKTRIGYDLQLGVTKHINHVVGIQLLYAWGHSKQGNTGKKIEAETKYQSLSLLGDINLTSLFRRVDNKSTYRWAWHLLGGVGVLDYNTYLNQAGKDYNKNDNNILGGSKSYDAQQTNAGSGINNGDGFYTGAAWGKNPLASFFGQVGTSLKFKINRRWDLEGKVMYVISGDDLFDGGGSGTNQQRYSHINALHKSNSDNMITTHLGISYKIGKHKEHLQWFDPLAELYPPKEATGGSGVCMEDKDEDAVCDDLDRQLDTPKGARVDGAGVAMDTDYDGLIDPLDKCPTIPGPVENQGCPLQEEAKIVDGGKKPVITDGSKLPAIEFLLDSDKLTNESTPILDNAAAIIKEYFPTDKIVVEGHTDAHSSDAYNQKLSQRRVETVVRYLGTKGVNTANLIPVGKGESELKLPQCQPATKCTDAQNKQNRRVVFKLQ